MSAVVSAALEIPNGGLGKRDVASGKIHVKPLKEAPAFLGGPVAEGIMPHGKKDEIIPDLNYSRIKRKQFLQDTTKYDDLRPFRTRKAERVFCRIFDEGDFYMHWRFHQGTVDTPPSLTLLLLPFEEDEEHPNTTTSIEPLEITVDEQPINALSMFNFWLEPSDDHPHTTRHSPGLQTLFNIEQTKFLMMRAIHLFLRQHAATIPCPPELCLMTKVSPPLSNYYAHYKLWADLLDIHMVASDVLLRTGSNKAAASMNSFAEALEARGKFLPAATIYDDAVEITTRSDLHYLWDETGLPEIRARTNAGLAYKRSGDYEMAFEAYATAIHNGHQSDPPGSFWEFHNNEDDRALLGNLVALLEDGVKYERTNAMYHCSLYIALLSLLGFPLATMGESYLQAKEHEHLLKPQVQRKPKKFFRELFATPTANHFETKIMTLGQIGLMKTRLQVDPSQRTTPFTKKEYKQTARSIVAEENNAYMSLCCNPTCSSGLVQAAKLKKCTACGGVEYCSKECQVAHWKNGHKQECRKIAKGKKRAG